jgi:hypothetical protein
MEVPDQGLRGGCGVLPLKRSRLLLAAAIAFPGAAAWAGETGSVCVAPGDFDAFSKGGATVEQEAAQAREPEPASAPEAVRYVRIDALAPVRVSSLQAAKITGIAIAGSHRVAIAKQAGMAQPVARFNFSFREQKSDKLCLWYETFYGTWRLQPQGRHVCRCP